jgi:hypothetical protein
MPLRDYEALDEDDFYDQGFERPGVVSVWLGTERPGAVGPNLDVLQISAGWGTTASTRMRSTSSTPLPRSR